jgi:hypothetical protein
MGCRLAIISPDFRRGPAFAGGIGEMGPVVGEDRVHPVGDGLDQSAQEARSGAAHDLHVQFDEGDLGGPVDRDNEIELSLRCSDLGEVDMEIADRIGLNLRLGEASPSTCGNLEIPWRCRQR